MIDIDRPHFDAVLAQVAHDLRRRVEAHRLRVEQRSREDVRIAALEPGRGIDQEREARGVAFREAVFAEALDLLEAALGEIARIAVATMPSIILILKVPMVPVRLKVAMARRN